MSHHLLRKIFDSDEAITSEIINLRAILNLPKGTEHFLSDLHGEYETFNHLLKSASGVIKGKIDQLFKDSLTNIERAALATLIYYPKERLKLISKTGQELDDYYYKTLQELIKITQLVASKYTRSKVRKAMPKNYTYILDELIQAPDRNIEKENYYNQILLSIIKYKRSDEIIIILSNLIQTLAIDRLHIIGDIFDRGPKGDRILDKLMTFDSVDIEYGNHDLLWMGGAFGNDASIANVIRLNLSYNNLRILEHGYAINLRPLALFAEDQYKDDPCLGFEIKVPLNTNSSVSDLEMLKKMHKAITIIQLKLESALILKHPEYEMKELSRFNEYGAYVPLSFKEQKIVSNLHYSFTHSFHLKEHLEFLLNQGSLYRVFNDNLLTHGCVPTNSDGSFTDILISGNYYSGKKLFDRLDSLIKKTDKTSDELDYMWYLWCGANSPVYGRNSMNTYEKYFSDVPLTVEAKNPYYEWIKEVNFADKILQEFSINPRYGHIINGHMPVHVKDGETPTTAEGKHITIDGGLSKAYHEKTGIAGYTLISSSEGIYLSSHQPFESTAYAVMSMNDLKSDRVPLLVYPRRLLVKETDIGKEIEEEISELEELLGTY